MEITSEQLKNFGSLPQLVKNEIIKELNDELFELLGEIEKHHEYLYSLPTKEERVKEQQRIIKNYKNERRKNQ